MLCTEGASRVQRWSAAPQPAPAARGWLPSWLQPSRAAGSVGADPCPPPYRRAPSGAANVLPLARVLPQPGRTEGLCCPAERTRDLRLETCDGRVRTLPQLTPWLRGRTVALVGDSLLNHLFVEWSRTLGAVEPHGAAEAKPDGGGGGGGGGGARRSKAAVLQASLAHWCARDAARAPERESFSRSHNVTLLKYSMHRRETARCNASADPTRRWLDGPAGGDSGGGRRGEGRAGGGLPGNDVDLSMLDAAMARADVVVVNVGVHWRDGHQRHYRRAVRAVLEQLGAANGRGNGSGGGGIGGIGGEGGGGGGGGWPIALYKQSTPQHFASADGSGYYEKRRKGGDANGPGAAARGPQQCAPLGAGASRPLSGKQWRTAIEAEEARAVFGAAASEYVVPSFGALAARWDGHAPPDCTHACFQQNLWDGMFDPFVRLLRNRLVERSSSTAISSTAISSSTAVTVSAGGHGHGRRHQVRRSSAAARAWGCLHLASTTCRAAPVAAAAAGPSPSAQHGGAAPPLIPRVIHQTHKSELRELPPGLRAAVATWERLNPDFEHVYYAEAAVAAYVRQRGGGVEGFAAAYAKATSGAMRCDLWRYLLLWLEGGVYADADALLQVRMPLPLTLHVHARVPLPTSASLHVLLPPPAAAAARGDAR